MYNGLFINSNQSAIIAENNLQNTSNALGLSLQKLSSGLRIVGAWVDPAGYQIAQGLNSTNLGIAQATRNSNNANSLVAIASGGLSTIQGMLGTMQTLATEAANGTSSASDLAALNSEYNQLASEITQLSQSTQFNGLHLLNGGSGSAYVTVQSAGQTSVIYTSATSFNFQIGYNANTATNQIGVTISGTEASQLGLNAGTVFLSSGTSVLTATEFISLSGINYYSASSSGGGSTLGNLGSYVYSTVAAGGNNGTAVQTSVDLLSTGDALTALSAIQQANIQVSGMSGQLGSYENRVTQILNNLQTEGQNTQAAYSQIMDVNFASQMATYTLQSTLAQSGEAMLAQANLVPQGLLTLLR